MARQATPGVDGRLKFSINIPARIGRVEIIESVIYFRSPENSVLPETRTDAKRLARDYLARYGATGAGSKLPDLSKERRSKIAARIDELFPEIQDNRE